MRYSALIVVSSSHSSSLHPTKSSTPPRPFQSPIITEPYPKLPELFKSIPSHPNIRRFHSHGDFRYLLIISHIRPSRFTRLSSPSSSFTPSADFVNCLFPCALLSHRPLLPHRPLLISSSVSPHHSVTRSSCVTRLLYINHLS